MTTLHLLWEPREWYTHRLAQPIVWPTAAAAPALAAGLALAAQFVFLHKSEAVLHGSDAATLPDRLFWSITYAAGVLSAFSYPALWLIATLWLLALGVLLDRTPQLSRTLGAVGLAFYSQVPYLLLMLAVVTVWQPPAIEPGHLAVRAGHFSERLAADPWFATLRIFGHASQVWLFILFGVGYRVATPQSRRSVVAAIVILYALFIGAGLVVS